MVVGLTNRPSYGLILAAMTSIGNVAMDVCRKKAVVKNDLISTTFWIRTAAGFVFAIAFLSRIWGQVHWPATSLFPRFAEPLPHLGLFLILLFLDTTLVGIGLLFYFRALQISDLSQCVPFLSFTPVLLIPTDYLFLHEIPTLGQLLGALLVVCGSLVMNRGAVRGGIFGPVRAVFQQRGSRHMLVVAAILSITNPMDKKVILLSDPVTYAFGYGTMLWLFYAILTAWRRKEVAASLRKSFSWIIIAGVLDAFVLLLQFTSHGYVDVLVTITIKRAGVILSVFAGWLIFRERHIGDRLMAAAVMLMGVFLLYFSLPRPAELLVFVSTLIVVVILLRLHPLPQVASGPVGLLPQEIASPRASTDQKPIIRCALVGCGEITLQYLSVYREIDWVSVVACVDIDLACARHAAQFLARFDAPEISVSTQLEAALHPGVDLVIVGTPNDLHRDHAIAAITRGKHVLLQKPLASTLEDGFAIFDAAAASAVTVGLYMSYFDQPLVHDLRRMVQEEWFGPITQIHARLMHAGGTLWSKQSAEGSRLWRASVEQTGGGAFIQLGVHYIRLLQWILDEPIISVQGSASNRLCPGLEGEDSAAALLKTASGIYATLNMSWCAEGEELAVHGLHGSLVYRDNRWITLCGNRSFEGHIVRYRGHDPVHLECIPPHLGNAAAPFNQHRVFLEAVRHRTQPFVTVEDGLQDLAVISAFYSAVRTGGTVEVISVNPNLKRRN